jgi:hypothetical protein
VNIGLIDQIARHALDHDYHAVLDGIFYADRYEQMLARLASDHRGRSRFYYLDVSMDETIRRHATRPQAADFSPEDMRHWYRARDLLGSVHERVIPQTSTLQDTIGVILADSQLLATLTETAAGSRVHPSGRQLARDVMDLRTARLTRM